MKNLTDLKNARWYTWLKILYIASYSITIFIILMPLLFAYMDPSPNEVKELKTILLFFLPSILIAIAVFEIIRRAFFSKLTKVLSQKNEEADKK